MSHAPWWPASRVVAHGTRPQVAMFSLAQPPSRSKPYDDHDGDKDESNKRLQRLLEQMGCADPSSSGSNTTDSEQKQTPASGNSAIQQSPATDRGPSSRPGAVRRIGAHEFLETREQLEGLWKRSWGGALPTPSTADAPAPVQHPPQQPAAPSAAPPQAVAPAVQEPPAAPAAATDGATVLKPPGLTPMQPSTPLTESTTAAPTEAVQAPETTHAPSPTPALGDAWQTWQAGLNAYTAYAEENARRQRAQGVRMQVCCEEHCMQTALCVLTYLM